MIAVSYDCDGNPGYSFYALWDSDGTQIESVSLWGPQAGANAPLVPDDEQEAGEAR